MLRIHYNGIVQIPLRYFGKQLLYYPPALVDGTLVLHNNNNYIDEQKDYDADTTFDFACRLLTKLERNYYIEGDYLYDTSPAINNTKSLTIVVCGDLPRKKWTSMEEHLESVINNTKFINQFIFLKALLEIKKKKY